jgi:dipeptidyl aminopeptidase/acylaminoacyl peptidase
LDAILFGIHEAEMKEDAEEEEEEAAAPEEEGEEEEGEEEEERPARRGEDEDELEKADLVIWHWQDDRLQSMQQVQEGRDKNFSYLSIYHVEDGRFVRLADDDVPQVTASTKGRWAVGYDVEDYELMGNLDGRRYRDVYAIDMRTGERRLALEGSRWNLGLSPDGSHMLYYQDGQYHTYEMAGGRRFNITQNVPTSFINSEDDHNVVDPPIYPIGWTSDSRFVLLYDNWDIWKVAVHGDRGVNLTVNGKADGIRYRRRFRLDPDEEGIDLSEPVYLAPYGEWTKRAGLGRINRGRPGVEILMWDDAGYGSLIKAEDADIYLFTRDTYEDYPNYHVTDASFRRPRQITDANPQQSEFAWTAGSMLLDYESEHGDRLQAALHLPADYEEGESYPTIVYIYERMSQTLNRYTTPSASGFNKSVYTSNGYAVLMPDITYRVDDPGMSAVWCVLPALEAAIETGVVDPERVGLQGHSWGGYQTAFLITQTDAFAAALAGAPLTNMISMYSSIYWNSGSANQPIFESSQGRFSGGYWEVPEAYTRNSPVYFAENVTTPLLLLHNDQDGAVDWNQGIEYFNTLRRLEKPVVMLQYVGENHGVRKPANQKDYTVRMREFFDHYLKGEPAPDWWTEGVPHLELEEHLEERAKLVKGREEEEGS